MRTGSPMEVVASKAELCASRASLTGTVAVVMTMGALHAGHASLIEAARDAADHVIVTVFVNPLQFGIGEDFERYPRTLDADRALCEAHGAALIFAPTRKVMYPRGEPLVRLDAGPLGEILEGRSRPGHFSGVLTVVLKLLALTRPDVAVFGEKDYQQLALIKAMVADLDLQTRVVGVPTIREPDGLALSSRNRYLSPGERAAAVVLSQALLIGREASRAGESASDVLRATLKTLAAEPMVALDYVAVADGSLGLLAAAGSAVDADGSRNGPAALGDVSSGAARLLIAARVGSTRLIDNIDLENA